jgi:hypothetical protein
MNSVTPAAAGRVGAGFQDRKAGKRHIFRAALYRSWLCLLLLLLAAPQAMAATSAACQDGATAVIDGTIISVAHYETGTYMYIDTTSVDCGPVYILATNVGSCDEQSTIHAEGTLSKPVDTNPYTGWNLSNTTDGTGTKYISSFSCK